MAQGPRDSQLDVVRLSPALPGTDEIAVPASGAPAGGSRPVHLSALPNSPAETPEVWLEGETLLCRCPECGAPMSIRLWLLLADCWQCQTSIELSEQQEREIQRLLADQAKARPATTPAKHVSNAPTSFPGQPPHVKFPAQSKVERPATSAPQPRTSQGEPAASAKAAPQPLDRNWLRDWLRQVPAWLVSLIVHLILLLVLALWDVTEDPRPLSLILSTAVSRDRVEGELNVPVDPNDEIAFDLPLPDNVNLRDRRVREAMLAADQDARQLQLDPNIPLPQMADLRQVRELVSSDDPARRSLAVRDPRLRVLVVKREGGTTLTEAAVSRGLRWLAQQQLADGHWSEHGRGWENAETSLALLPFLGAGQTHFTGLYKDQVAKGLRWLLRRQRENGDLRGGESQHPGMYAHGIAAIVLCDAFAMTGDEALRAPAQKAVDFIVSAQSPDGGWRYFPRQDSDLSVVGWQLMALQSARMSGLTVPDETLTLASQYLDKVGHEGGSIYSYQHRGGEARPTPAMTAEGLLSRMYLGWRRDEPSLRLGVEVLHDAHLPSQREQNIYYWYYATQVFHHYGGQPWDDWNRRMRDLLVQSQVAQGQNAGSWNPAGDRWGSAGGRIFVTSLSICCLEVYYRHAPIYRRIDLE